MAQYTKSQLVSASNATYFTNTSGGISASAVRDLNDSWISSSALLSGSNTFIGNQIISGNLDISGTITASLQTGYLYVGDSSGKTQAVATSSIIANTDTSSLLVTASFASTNITFTKGDATTFDLPGFATTGSNTFNGDQTINGILTVSSSANSYLQFTSPNSATGSGKIFFGQNGPYIQTYSDSNPDNQGLQLVGGLSGSFALATRYGGQNAKIDLDAMADQSNPATSRGRIQVKTNGQIDLSGFGNAITISGSQTTIQGLRYPGTDGTNGQVITTNGSGVLTFTTVASSIDTGSFATTGSNSFNGNQTITGSLTISSSATTDLTVVGQIFVSSSATGGTTQPRITVSGSAGQSIINRNNISTRNTTNIAQLNPAGVFMNSIATADEIGFGVDTGSFSGWAFGPGIYVNNTTDTYPAIFGFQNKANYTDGRVTVLTPLSASAGFTASLQNGYAWVGNSLGQNTQVATSSFGTSIDTGSFATTGSNTFRGNQNLDGKLTISGSDTNQIFFERQGGGDILRLGVSQNGNTFELGLTGSVNKTMWLIDNLGGVRVNTFDAPIVGTSYLSLQGALTASLQQGYAWVGNASGISTLVATSSFGGGTTYINPTLNPYSGSLILVANTFTSSSFAHISASANGQVNLVFKNNNNTQDTILSGSGNIFVNPATVTPLTTPITFKRYIGGSGNIILNGSNVPQISGSMAFSPTMNNNYFGGNSTVLNMRGPVSSSAWTISSNISLGSINIGSNAIQTAEKIVSGLTMTGNSIAGTLTIIANQSALTGSATSFTNNIITGQTILNLSSSAAALQNNIINDSGFVFTNQFYTGSLGVGSVAMNRNNIGGQGNSITISGSLPLGTTTTNSISDNFIFGGSNTIYIDVQNARVSGTTAYINVVRTGLMGNQLIVSGSSLLADGSSYGSVFVGRYNADDNRRNKTSDTVFAVGTGNTTTRKTGFLIDSGSNSYFEGTLNVSGSTSFTGSVAMSSFTTLASVSSSLNFADDTAAAAGGVPLGGLYRNGNFVMIRLT